MAMAPESPAEAALRDLCVVDPKSLATGGGASRLFARFADAGAVSQVGPTRILTPLRNLELPRRGGTEAWRLHALLDCALEAGMGAVAVDYLDLVCRDSQAVSSDPAESFLMSESLVKDWALGLHKALKREIHVGQGEVDTH